MDPLNLMANIKLYIVKKKKIENERGRREEL